MNLYHFSVLGRFFVVHEETGSSFEVDSSTYKKLEQGEVTSELREQLPTAPSLEWLLERLERKERPWSALCLNITHTCNMACKYCFASQGSYRGAESVMPVDVAKRAVERLMNTPSEWVDIDFFGGEPLLGWDTVRATLEHATELAKRLGKKVRFSLTTNGLLLDEAKMDVLDAYNVNLTLSLDGPPPVHDLFRVDRAGAPTFDKVIDRFKVVDQRRKGRNYYIRGTFTHQTLHFSEAVKFLVDAGFKTISMEPVTGQGQPWSLVEEDLPIIEEEYARLAEFYVERAKSGKRFYFYHFEMNPTNPPSVVRRFTGCGAGVEYVVVNPAGLMYPCHQFDNVSRYCMGDVNSELNMPHPDFLKAHAFNKPHCGSCWARALCGGGCHADGYFTTGDILGQNPISCEIVRLRLKYALAVNAALQSDNEQTERPRVC
ncbi:radical SAM protein [Coprothermobacteraceae bacterium]|nr:radical SAM protein [Coprothermobacteraceae bacterium]